MSLPEFYLIGAPRSGTTTLYHALREHPQVFMPAIKEPRTLAYPDGPPPSDATYALEDVPDEAAYMAAFEGAAPGQLRGEASTNYLSSAVARKRIARDRPEARIIAILREPAGRAYSNYMQHRRDGREDLDFGAALIAEPDRLTEGWSPYYGYRRMSTYAEDIAAWQAAFPDMLVLLYDELKDHPGRTMKKVFRHLGIDAGFQASVVRHNASGIRRERGFAHRALTSRSPLKRVYNAVLPERLRLRIWVWLRNRTLQQEAAPIEAMQALREALRDDVERTATLIGRDLSHWMEA